MANRDELKAFLTARRGQFFCTKCLSEQVPVRNIVQVNQIIGPLKDEPRYRSGKVICHGCNEERDCISFG